MTPTHPSPKGTDPEEILCQLCGRPLRTITWTHLVKSHGFDQEGAVSEYKRRFGVEYSKCPALLDLVTKNVRRYFERVGRRWTKARIRREIRDRARGGIALNHGVVALEAKGLENAALRTFGSWDAALRASGISVDQARLQRAWTRESLREGILKIQSEGGALNSKAMEKRDPGLRQTACRLFGTWDLALLACGIDPLSVRKQRSWSREDVLRDIRKLPPLRSYAAFQGHKKLWVAARKHFGSWAKAVLAAARAIKA
ncbi:MAG TPA: hypothetical protein VG457_13765 [Planctomycetota bacterium]|nr:hypothetical protein [Planctomycetota bacterium]